MMKYFYLFVLIISLFSACKNTSVQSMINSYRKSLSFFEDSLVKHFPRKYEHGGYRTTVLGSTDTIRYFFKSHRLYFYTKYSDQKYPIIRSSVDSLAKAVYSANDSTLLLVLDYRDKVEADGSIYDDTATPLEKELARRNKNTSKSLPVPLFNDKIGPIYTSITYSGFRDGFKLYVLDADSGFFLPSNKLSDSSMCLPEKWEHGYSRGVALNDETQEAIYWIVVW